MKSGESKGWESKSETDRKRNVYLKVPSTVCHHSQSWNEGQISASLQNELDKWFHVGEYASEYGGCRSISCGSHTFDQ
jgi:hypothetical protein